MYILTLWAKVHIWIKEETPYLELEFIKEETPCLKLELFKEETPCLELGNPKK